MGVEELLQRRFVDFSGNQFQKLFFEIMRCKYHDLFVMPEAYGNVGDFKCDGILTNEGFYFACYAPENPYDSTIANPICKKLEDDLKGLEVRIDDGTWKTILNKFVFVINMKYSNTIPAPVYTKAQGLERSLCEKYKREIKISLRTQYDLKLIFLGLDSKLQQFILNKIYYHEEDINFDGSIIATIIEHFHHNIVNKVGVHNIMQFKDKLTFNNLSSERCADLECASYNISALELFLRELSSDSLVILQSTIVNLYNDSKEKFPNDSNSQFDYIKNKIYVIPNGSSDASIKSINETVLIIMSKFFENCTIFESENSKWIYF